MRDISDVHLEMPAVRPLINVNGVIEVTRRLAVYRDNRQMAKIPASLPFGVSYCPGGTAGLIQHFLGERMRQMMFADQDFDIESEFAGMAKNFQYTARPGHARSRKS